MRDLSNFLESPDFYPLYIDFTQRVVEFVGMDRSLYRKSVFLDHRTRSIKGVRYKVALDDV